METEAGSAPLTGEVGVGGLGVTGPDFLPNFLVRLHAGADANANPDPLISCRVSSIPEM